jgi:hypothetical protein
VEWRGRGRGWKGVYGLYSEEKVSTYESMCQLISNVTRKKPATFTMIASLDFLCVDRNKNHVSVMFTKLYALKSEIICKLAVV